MYQVRVKRYIDLKMEMVGGGVGGCDGDDGVGRAWGGIKELKMVGYGNVSIEPLRIR